MIVSDGGFAVYRAPLDAMLLWVAGLCILAVWAACSSRHWFVRALVLVLAIAAMLPIRANEPVMLFLFVAPAIVMLLLAIRWLFASNLADAAVSSEAPNVRVSTGIQVLAGCYAVFFILCIMAIVLPVVSGSWHAYSVRSLNWYEWSTFGTLVIGPLALVVLVRRGNRMVGAEETGQGEVSQAERSVRFGLRDLLLAVVIVAMLSGILATVLKRSLFLDWLGLLGTAACVAGVTVTASSVVLFRRGRVYVAFVLPLVVAGAAALHVWLLPDGFGLESVLWSTNQFQTILTFGSAFSALAGVVTIGTYLLLAVGALGGPSGANRIRPRGARLVVFCMCLTIYGPLLVVYWRMLAVTPGPAYAPPETNAYPEVVSAVNRLAQLIPPESTIDQIRDPAKREEAREAYDSLMRTLASPAHISMDMERDAHEEYFTEQLPLIQNLRLLSRALQMEGEAEQSRGQYDRAADYGLATVRLAGTQQKGGLVISVLVGLGLEELAVGELAGVRGDISMQRAEQLLDQLVEVDCSREPRRATFAREAMWSDHVYTWRNSLLREAPIVLASLERNEFSMPSISLPTIHATDCVLDRRDVKFRLLLTELAIRLFRHDNDRLPETLSELTPDYLPAAPIDPYSGNPLIYRPTGDGYALYSVGRDGDDDGGKFGTVADIYSQDFDLDLDMCYRPKTPTGTQETVQEDPDS